MSASLGPRSKYTLRLPRALAERVRREARARGVPVNAYLVRTLEAQAVREEAAVERSG